jgi:hypothetical protein
MNSFLLSTFNIDFKYWIQDWLFFSSFFLLCFSHSHWFPILIFHKWWSFITLRFHLFLCSFVFSSCPIVYLPSLIFSTCPYQCTISVYILCTIFSFIFICCFSILFCPHFHFVSHKLTPQEHKRFSQFKVNS